MEWGWGGKAPSLRNLCLVFVGGGGGGAFRILFKTLPTKCRERGWELLSFQVQEPHGDPGWGWWRPWAPMRWGAGCRTALGLLWASRVAWEAKGLRLGHPGRGSYPPSPATTHRGPP